MVPLKIMFVGYFLAFGLSMQGYLRENPRWFIWSIIATFCTTMYGALRLLEYVL